MRGSAVASDEEAVKAVVRSMSLHADYCTSTPPAGKGALMAPFYRQPVATRRWASASTHTCANLVCPAGSHRLRTRVMSPDADYR